MKFVPQLKLIHYVSRSLCLKWIIQTTTWERKGGWGGGGGEAVYPRDLYPEFKFWCWPFLVAKSEEIWSSGKS